MKIERNIKLLAWFNFFVDFKFYAPVAILYFAQVSGSFVLGMSVFAIVQISIAIFEIPTGIFSDKIGRKSTIVLGAITSVMYVFMYALGSYETLVVGAILEGIARAFYSGNNEAFLHDTLSELNKKKAYSTYLGKTSSMFQFAGALAAISGAFIAYFSYTLALWLSLIPQTISVAISLRMVEPIVHSKESGNLYNHLLEAIKLFIHQPKLRLLSLISMISYALGESSYQFQSAFYAIVWPVWAIGFAKVLSNLGAASSFYYSGKIIKRFSELSILVLGTTYSRFISIVALMFPTLLSPLLLTTTSLLHGASSVAKSTLLQKEFTQEKRATMGSLISFGGSLLFALFALTLGKVADSFDPRLAMLIIQPFFFITLFLYWRFHKLQQV